MYSRPRFLLLLLLQLLPVLPAAKAADWNQWRGPWRNGVAEQSPRLRDGLPDSGIKPLWIRRGAIPAARSGGWSSPVVADGRVFLFVHRRAQMTEDELPKVQFPYLAPEKRSGMSEREYAEHERKRRDEQESRSRFYRFDELVVSFDARDGSDLWKNTRKSVYTRFPQSGSPAVVDGRVFLLGAGRMARCLSAADGKQLWQRRLPGEFRDQHMQSSCLVADGVAVVLCQQLYGLSAESGEILWSTEAQQIRGSHSSPVIWNDDGRLRVIANVGGGQTACFDLHDGREQWRVRSNASHSTPVVSGDLMITFGSSRKAGLRCFHLKTQGAEEVWTYHGLADKGSSPVVMDGHVYVQGERNAACVELATGEEKWLKTIEMTRPQYTSLIGGDGKLLYTYDGLLCFAASPEGYRQLAQAKIDESGLLADEEDFRRLLNMDELERTPEGRKRALRAWQKRFKGHGPLPCSSPALAAGRLYIRLQDGLACYDLTAP